MTGAEQEPPDRRPPVQTVSLPGWHYEYQSSRILSACPLIHINLGQYGVHWACGVTASGNPATASHIATGGAASAHIAIGDAVRGRSPLPKRAGAQAHPLPSRP
jgi:hypothetical protein